MSRREKEKREARRVSAREWSKKPALGGFEATCIKPPDGFEMIKLPNEGLIKWDFMPYVCGKYNRRCDEGMDHFEL